MFLIISNRIYWVNKILYIFSVFLQSYLLPKRQKKNKNFRFLMLKFTISVSNLDVKPIWATFEFLPVITIIWNYPYPNFQRPSQLSTLVSRAPKFANFFPKFQKWQILQTHRFYRPHYSNPIFNAQRQFCPYF